MSNTDESNERTPLQHQNADHTLFDQVFEPLTHRRESSAIDIAMESLVETVVEVKDAIVETAADVKEAVAEGIEEIQHVIQEPIIDADNVQPRQTGTHEKKLGVTALAVLVFYKVCGGPFGCEPAVKAAGPFYAITGFALFPIFWCIPEAFITAELGSAYPEPSGAIAWVEEAFGPKTSLLAGYFHYVSGSTDNAIYPSLFLKYIASAALGDLFDKNAWLRFVFAVTITIVLSIVNYFGLEIVGNLSIAVCAMSMSPFAVLCAAALPKIKPSRWLVRRPSRAIHWRPFLNSLFWNLNSFDAGANFAGELQDPARVFPRAMFMSVGMVASSYLLPLLAALGAADTNSKDWTAGYFTTVSSIIAGPWLGVWIVFAAAISNIALYEAELSGDAYQLLGMAERGMIPKLFAKRSRFGTPTNGILTGTIIIIIMSMADFEQLVEMLNFAYAFSFLLEFAAFVKLRITHADVERPYKIPLNTVGCFLFILPPCLFLVYLLLFASKLTYIYCTILVLLGIFLEGAQKVAKHYKLLEYVEPQSRTRQRRVEAVVQL